MKPEQIEDRIGLFLTVLALLALVALWTGGCQSNQPSRERVWHNGQWVDRIELEKGKK